MWLLMFSILTGVRIASHRQNSREFPHLRSCEIIPAIRLIAEARRRRGLNAKGHFSAPLRLCGEDSIFHSFSGPGQARLGRAWAENMEKDFFAFEAGRLLKKKAWKCADSIAPNELMKTNDLY